MSPTSCHARSPSGWRSGGETLFFAALLERESLHLPGYIKPTPVSFYGPASCFHNKPRKNCVSEHQLRRRVGGMWNETTHSRTWRRETGVTGGVDGLGTPGEEGVALSDPYGLGSPPLTPVGRLGPFLTSHSPGSPLSPSLVL